MGCLDVAMEGKCGVRAECRNVEWCLPSPCYWCFRLAPDDSVPECPENVPHGLPPLPSRPVFPPINLGLTAAFVHPGNNEKASSIIHQMHTKCHSNVYVLQAGGKLLACWCFLQAFHEAVGCAQFTVRYEMLCCRNDLCVDDHLFAKLPLT